MDFAVRYSQTLGEIDLGTYHFRGTGREPTLLLSEDKLGSQVLTPYYQQINQTGLDLQMVAGQWLWKLESIYQTGRNEDFFASAAGFEYTLVNIIGSSMDLGSILEYAYDDRGDTATTGFDNDLMAGLRLAVNDVSSTEVLIGYIHDLDNSSKRLGIEASYRFTDNIKATVEARFFFDIPEDDLLASVLNDDFIEVTLSYYF